jgi:hypothetical protein
MLRLRSQNFSRTMFAALLIGGLAVPIPYVQADTSTANSASLESLGSPTDAPTASATGDQLSQDARLKAESLSAVDQAESPLNPCRASQSLNQHSLGRRLNPLSRWNRLASTQQQKLLRI